jgi:hypothetical protein
VTDAAFILSVLEDGERHSQAELLRRSFQERGCGLTVHSRISSLRGEGHVITCEHVKGAQRGEAWVYQLLASPVPESDLTSVAPDLPSDRARTHRDGGRSGSETGEQVPLFTYPRSPSWA